MFESMGRGKPPPPVRLENQLHYRVRFAGQGVPSPHGERTDLRRGSVRGLMAKTKEKVGLWMIGASGGVGTTIAVGLEAIRKGLTPPTGLITETAPFTKLGLTPLAHWVVGGHEIRRMTISQAAAELQQTSALFGSELLARCKSWLRQCDRNVRDGTVANCGTTITKMADRPGAKRKASAATIVARLTKDIRDFQKRNKLDRVVVLNVSSTEPPFSIGAMHRKWSSLSKALDKRAASPLPASSLYALAAIEAGAIYINFTPCIGIDIPALRERADACGTPYMGCDGKTGETLMKSVLAPMFPARNLNVMSWVGHNIFGNRDGLVLDDPKNKSAKTKSKDHLVGQMLGYKPKTLVSIEYIESMGDWKTAWDHIHFEGFLNTKMALQFIWQGCDSILAAPLAIDLARFAAHSHARGESGALKHLAGFFKSPMDVQEQGFARQYETLLKYAQNAR